MNLNYVLTNLSTASNICLSGGADGSDLQWGMTAGMLGHTVIHWSFAGHKTQAPAKEIVVLTDDQLNEANAALEKANITLKRYLNFKKYYIKLLQRNYFQIRWSNSVYAISSLDKHGIVKGGTSWAVQMFIDMVKEIDPEWNDFDLYVYDQQILKWYQWRNEWIEIHKPKRPSNIWAGIGTRELDTAGKNAIRELMNYN